MNKLNALTLLATLFWSLESFAGWTGYLSVSRVEVHESGVFLKTSITGLNESGCSAEQVYTFAQFPSSNEKLADRALSSTYFALASKKRIRVNVISCNGGYAVSNAIWIES